MTALPTKRDETWRYSDLEAVARVWPVATRSHVVAPGETFVLPILVDDIHYTPCRHQSPRKLGAGRQCHNEHIHQRMATIRR